VTARSARQQEAIDEFLDLLRLDRRSETWVGRTPDWAGPVVFGGIALLLTTGAACRDAPEGKRLHSLHAHFLRPVKGGQEVVFRSEVLKAGRAFELHLVTASQDGKPAITMTCSFTGDTDGYVYDLSGIPDGVPLPDELPEPEEVEGEVWSWDTRWLGPSDERPDGTREATHRHWFRLPRLLGDDAHLHTALLAYATDWTGVGGRPLHLDGDTTGMISLDHLVPPPGPRRRVAAAGRPEPRQRWRPGDAAGRDPQHLGPDRGVDGPGDAPPPGR
jgi:acyl-CoA thioesterase-2